MAGEAAFKKRVAELQRLGFSDYEARTYVCLLHGHPLTAYEISKDADIPRANVYRVLEGLERKKAVQPVSKDPSKYVPVNPKEVLGRIARETVEQCRFLTEDLRDLGPYETRDYVWMLEGQKAIQLKIDEMIDSAKQHVWIKAHTHTISQHVGSLRRAAQRGVRILIILIGTPGDAKLFRFGRSARVYLHEGSGRSGIGSGVETITVTKDFAEALTVDPSDGEHAAHTASGPVVNLANTMIRHELYVAEILIRYWKEIEKAFGPALIDIRKDYLPKEQLAALEEHLKKFGPPSLPVAGHPRKREKRPKVHETVP